MWFLSHLLALAKRRCLVCARRFPRKSRCIMVASKKHDGPFYSAFEQHAACLVEAARLLADAFNDIGKAGELAEKIRELEHEGDKITHDTIARLHKMWITPLDGADIRRLITT